MMVVLPKPIADYFNADKTSSADVAECFTATASVTDAGLNYTGHKAIKKWNSVATTKYQYTCDPIAAEANNGVQHVLCHLEGEFPGSPLNLLYRFTLEGPKIAALEIG